MDSRFMPASHLPDDLDPVRRRGRPRPPPAFGDYPEADPFSSRRPHANPAMPSRFESASPPRAHHGRRARAQSPLPRAYSPPRRTRAHSPPPAAYNNNLRRAHSPPRRRYSPSPPPRARSQPRRHYDEDHGPYQRVKEPRGRRAYTPDSRDFRPAHSTGGAYYRDDSPDRHRSSRSNPPPRYQSPRRRYQSPSPARYRRDASPSMQHPSRHQSVPGHKRQGGGGGGGKRKGRSSSVGNNQVWTQAAQTAFRAGAAAAYKMRNDPSPWVGEKGTKVASAALGAAIVDTFMGQRYPKKMGGFRHNAMRQAAQAAVGNAFVKPAVNEARKRY